MVSTTSIRKTTRPPNAGFSLAEVMVATFLFVLTMMAILATILNAYKLVLSTRYEDRAFNALRTIADQFQNSTTTDREAVVDATNPNGYKTIFLSTSGAKTGTGLAWDGTRQTFAFPTSTNTSYIVGDENGLTINLGTVSDAIQLSAKATIKRQVDVLIPDKKPIGGFARAIFTADVTYLGRTKTLTLVALRNLNPSDQK